MWTTFLEKFAESVRGSITGLIYYDTTSRSGNLSSAVHIDPAVHRKYEEYYTTKHNWAAGAIRLSIEQGEVFYGEELCPYEEFVKGESHNDSLVHLNAFHELGVVVLKSGPVFSVIASLRPKSAGAFGQDEGRLLKQLVPHLQRALQLHRRILGLETRSQAAADALDRLPTGLILVDEQGKILMVNRVARTILDKNDGLTLTRDGLTTTRADETDSLRKLIQCASMTTEGKGFDSGGVMSLTRPSFRRPLSILITPLTSNGFELGQERPAAAIFVSDPEIEHTPSDQILIRLFGLTPAESRVALLLMQAKTVEEIANELAITLNTARTHVKRVLEKTNTHRQGELIRLLMSGPAGLHLS